MRIAFGKGINWVFLIAIATARARIRIRVVVTLDGVDFQHKMSYVTW